MGGGAELELLPCAQQATSSREFTLMSPFWGLGKRARMYLQGHPYAQQRNKNLCVAPFSQMHNPVFLGVLDIARSKGTDLSSLIFCCLAPSRPDSPFWKLGYTIKIHVGYEKLPLCA